MVPDDTELMRRIQAGEEAAFELFVQRYQRKLYRLAYATLGEREEALDATQETFVKIYRARHRWRPEAAPSTWVHRILINHCIDRSRRRKIRESTSLDDPQHPIDVARPEPNDSPLARREQQRRRDLLSAAIAKLPERQRLVVVLRHSNDLPLEAIAATLGCSVGTVKSTLHRALGRLRVLMLGRSGARR